MAMVRVVRYGIEWIKIGKLYFPTKEGMEISGIYGGVDEETFNDVKRLKRISANPGYFNSFI